MEYTGFWSYYIWNFLRSCMDTPRSLPSLVVESLSFYVSSHSYYSPGWLLETSLLLFKDGAIAHLWFSLVHRPGLFFWEHFIYQWMSSHSFINEWARLGVHTRNFPLKSWMQPPMTAPLSCSLTFLSASFLISFLQWVMEFLPQSSGCCWWDTGFSNSNPHSCGCRTSTHCSLSITREVVASSGVQCCREWGIALASSSFCLQCIQALCFSSNMLKSPVGKPGLLQNLSPRASVQVSRFSQAVAWRSCGRFSSSCWFHIHNEVCLLPDTQVGKSLPRPFGIWCWILHLPLRCFHSWIDAWLVVTQNGRTSYATDIIPQPSSKCHPKGK